MGTNITVVKAPGKVGIGIELAANPITAADDFVAAAASMEFFNDGNTLLLVDNQDASPSTIAFTVNTIEGMTITAPSTAQAADSFCIYGPFPPDIYNDSDGKVNFTTSNQTTVFVAAIEV